MNGNSAELAVLPCRRCKDNPSTIVVRSEPLCSDCFTKYVRTKIVKRWESFRVRNSTEGFTRKLLLPVSFGVSSISLLHVVDEQFQRQKERSNRTGYELHVLFVNMGAAHTDNPSPAQIELLREKFSNHKFYVADLPSDVPDEILSAVASTNPGVSEGLNGNHTSTTDLAALLQQLPSATARADLLFLLRTRFITSFAQKHTCESILWGDSTTRLSEKTLSETAKGRGFALPWHVSDGESTSGVFYHYPCRDLLKKELVAYSEMTEPPLTEYLAVPSGKKMSTAVTKNTTIDDLMKQYFESVEENFPSIVANVVRTTGRFETPKIDESTPRCIVCQMPVLDERFGIHGWGGDQNDETQLATQRKICYGCSRSISS